MRHAAALLGLSVALAASGADAMVADAMVALPGPARDTAAAPLVRVGYYCSPGFEATSGGRCVATASTDPVDLYLNEPPGDAYSEPAPVRHRHRGHKRLHERY